MFNSLRNILIQLANIGKNKNDDNYYPLLVSDNGINKIYKIEDGYWFCGNSYDSKIKFFNDELILTPRLKELLSDTDLLINEELKLIYIDTYMTKSETFFIAVIFMITNMKYDLNELATELISDRKKLFEPIKIFFNCIEQTIDVSFKNELFCKIGLVDSEIKIVFINELFKEIQNDIEQIIINYYYHLFNAIKNKQTNMINNIVNEINHE